MYYIYEVSNPFLLVFVCVSVCEGARRDQTGDQARNIGGIFLVKTVNWNDPRATGLDYGSRETRL